MPLSWTQRLSRLSKLLGTSIVADDEERQGRALDEYLLTPHLKENRQIANDLDALRFNDADLSLIGKLAIGQFGTVDVVRCRLDSRVYARKTIEKRTAIKTRGQCSPQLERDILVRALKTDTVWAPHILCAFQTETALKVVMEYADGGNLWDVIESLPEAKFPESDLRWWVPQIVSAIEWCHSQGVVHRDIKPHNFVLTPTSHLLLVDFGSAAPLLPPLPSGVQLVPKEECLVPCGTCDYISPEILQYHEEALVALELEDDDDPARRDTSSEQNVGGYGRETDWWSFGAMLYEMAFGIAPFFANDVRQTYVKIVEHRTSLSFSSSSSLSSSGISLLEGVLCDDEHRLGRHSVDEIKDHPFFHGIDWAMLHRRSPPSDLHLPQFTYTATAPDNLDARISPIHEDKAQNEAEQSAQPFAFSALFHSSRSSAGLSFLRTTPENKGLTRPINHALDNFVGFSWGPRLNAFNPTSISTSADLDATPRPPLHREPVNLTPRPALPLRATDPLPLAQIGTAAHAFRTPVRTGTLPLAHGQTISHPLTGTGRTQGRRPVSDREAMQQLVDCVGMSARKKVLESGKKPAYLRTSLEPKKEIRRFVPVPKPLVINARKREDMSTTSSGSDSQPPSPTPRPGSAMSRRSGWGGRSTPSLMAGRLTPTLTFTATGTVSSTVTGGIASGSGTATRSSPGRAIMPDSAHNSTWPASYDLRLRDAERRHSRLLDELASLGEGIETVALRLRHEC